MKKASVTVDISWSDLLELARELFGERLTAVILTGHRQPVFRSVSELAEQPAADRAALGAALEIAKDLLALESRSTVQAWFVGKNSLLDDRAPALVIRTDPDAVRAADRQFVAYG
jgi:hypothetical protein